MNPPTEPTEPTEPTDPTGPVAPLDADTVDELLSAELDGEFDAAASDVGLSVTDARARLDATPGAHERRSALTAARDAFATPVAALPASRRDEMLAVARRGSVEKDELARRRHRPLASRLAGIAVAAAAILLVVGLAVSIATSGSDNGDDSSAAGGSAADSATESTNTATQQERTAEGLASVPPSATSAGPLYDFGAVPDETTLQARVSDALSSRSTSGLDQQDAAEDLAGARVAVSDECLATQAANFAVAPTPTLRGPVEYQGTAAEVLVFPRGDDSLALTVATDDCRLLVSLFVHP